MHSSSVTTFLLSIFLLLSGAARSYCAQDTLLWTEQTSGVTKTLWCVHFVDTLHGWAAGDYGSMVRTTDGGTTWTTCTFPSSDSARAIAFINPQTGWTAGVKGTIYASVDSGKTWTSAYSNDFSFLGDARFLDEQTGFFVGQKGFDGLVVRTTDGGQNWEEITVDGSAAFGSIWFATDSIGWVAGRDDVSKTTDRGATWSRAITPPITNYKSYIGVIGFTDILNGFGLGRYGGITRTYDGGATWSLTDTTLARWIQDIDFADSLRGAMVGERGLIRYTNNGGTSWIRTQPRHPYSIWAPWFRAIHFVDTQHAWTVADSGIIMKGRFYSDETDLNLQLDSGIRPSINIKIQNGRIIIQPQQPDAFISKLNLFSLSGRLIYSAAGNHAVSIRNIPLKSVSIAEFFLSNGKRHSVTINRIKAN